MYLSTHHYLEAGNILQVDKHVRVAYGGAF
jgi:hypothetical protein